MSDKWEESARTQAEECLVTECAIDGIALWLKIHPSVPSVLLGTGPPVEVASLREQVVAHLACLIGQLEDERREAAAGEDW